MFYESSMLPRNQVAKRRWADETGEKFDTVEKLVLVVASVVVAAGTLLLPVALLHLG